MPQLRFGVLTVSDTCSKDASKDTSGPKLVEHLRTTFPNCAITNGIVKDDVNEIKSILRLWSTNLHVVFTTGGTGFAPRDVTPEATKEIIEREVLGLIIAMMNMGLKSTPLAMLSRAMCGISGKTLIINFPGKLKAVVECFDSIKEVIPHAVALINDDISLVQLVHSAGDSGAKNVPATKSKVLPVCPNTRIRQSPYKMIEVSDAIDIILSKIPKSNESESININDAIGRKLFENVYSMDPIPPFRAAIKDGYAVKRLQNTDPPLTWAGDPFRHQPINKYTINSSIKAGDSMPNNLVLKEGEAVEISTGAPVPDSADAVVQIEDTSVVLNENAITINVPISLNQDIREIGSDVPASELIFKKDVLVDVGVLGVLAAIGKDHINVYKNPAIGIISTGNELQDYTEKLKPYHIRDTNKITLKTILKQFNFNSNDCGIVKDNADELKAAFEAAFEKNDFIITTGGVSMGEYDLVKKVLEVDFNANIHFGRVNMKPGKPTTFATCLYNGSYKIIFALPGNPVSAAVTAYLFVIPALRYYANCNEVCLPIKNVRFGETSYKLDPRPEYARASIVDGKAYLQGNQISSRVNSLVGATILLKLPSATKEQTHCALNSTVEAILIT